jgi:shikimate dehydrogenase
MTSNNTIYTPPKVFASFAHPNTSIAPIVYNYAFREHSLNSVYVSFDCGYSYTAADAIRKLNIQGATISMPLKEDILSYVDSYDKHVRKIGALNVITNKNNELKGYNTDWLGALNVLKKHTCIEGKNIAIVGAGGVAKAIAYGLTKYNCKVFIFNRDLLKAKQLVHKFSLSHAGHLTETELIEKADIIINATPMGSNHLLRESFFWEHISIKKDHTILDVVISQSDTLLIDKAKKVGCNYSSGIDMYLSQAFYAFYLFTNRRANAKKLHTELIERFIIGC